MLRRSRNLCCKLVLFSLHTPGSLLPSVHVGHAAYRCAPNDCHRASPHTRDIHRHSTASVRGLQVTENTTVCVFEVGWQESATAAGGPPNAGALCRPLRALLYACIAVSVGGSRHTRICGAWYALVWRGEPPLGKQILDAHGLLALLCSQLGARALTRLNPSALWCWGRRCPRRQNRRRWVGRHISSPPSAQPICYSVCINLFLWVGARPHDIPRSKQLPAGSPSSGATSRTRWKSMGWRTPPRASTTERGAKNMPSHIRKAKANT